MALSRGDGRYVRRLGQLARIGLLVLDDFLLTPPSVMEAKDLLAVIDDRSQVRSTLNASWLITRGFAHPHPPLRVGLSLEGEAASAASGEGAYAAEPAGKHLVVSQLRVEAWHPALAGGDPTLADAILERLVQHAHRMPLSGASMRRRQPPPEENSVA